ncbi:MAG: hypothetical protein Q9162_001995 [Coniocarpon cinnabarinum]
MPPIKCLLFDCDNTLVLSESLAFEACADLANEIIAQYAPNPKPGKYSGPELQADFVGQNFRGMMVGLQDKYKFTIPSDKFDAYVEQEMHAVIAKLNAKAAECPGATEVCTRLQKEGKYEMAIVSSSAMPRVLASIDKVGQDKFFPRNKVFSAATSLDPPTSKPNPAIYLHACEKLGYKPSECVAIEDSRSGATAAKNAKIPLIGYVGPYYEEGGADKVKQMEKVLGEECGAVVVMHDWKEFDACLDKVLKS